VKVSSEHIQQRLADGILTIVLDRPNKKNALSKDMYRDITGALERARKDEEIRVVVLQGSDTCFSAGNDLADFEERDPGEKSPGIMMLETLAMFEKPIIAAVAGMAIGIGVTTLLHCDLVYAEPGTRFRMPFVQLGVCPEGASTLLIPLHAGHQRAARLMLTGDFFSTQDAMDAGIVSEQVPVTELFDHAQATASKLAGMPQRALRESKRLMKLHLKKAVMESIETESQVFNELLESGDSKAARSAARNPGR
jgi:enoyl-CoA hydratase/carnithine racemase